MTERWTCKTCRGWLNDGRADETAQDCRKLSPRSVSKVDKGNPWQFAVWPLTFPDDWCEEHHLLRPDKSIKWDVLPDETEEQYLARHGASK